MEKNMTSRAAVNRVGVHRAETHRFTTMSWLSARPAFDLCTSGVSSAPSRLTARAELCPSPDQVPVAQSYRPKATDQLTGGAATSTFPRSIQANGGSAALGAVPTIQGSIRPAPPG